MLYHDCITVTCFIYTLCTALENIVVQRGINQYIVIIIIIHFCIAETKSEQAVEKKRWCFAGD